MVSGEDRKIKVAAFTEIAAVTDDDHPRHAAHLCPDRQIPAPGGRVDAGPLLDDDDVARRCRLDGCRAEMTPVGSTARPIQLDRPYTPRNGSIRRQAVNPRDHALQAK